MQSEPLNIRDKTFLVNRLIQQAPVSTLVREFVKNAEESAAEAPPGNRRILIYPTEIDGVRKLTFWNTGPGMSAGELKVVTDLSSSINKAMALDGNFGIGAKVSGLAASPHGIRYRSCKEGRVSEVTIGFDEEADTYVRFAWELPDGTSDTVIDVTEICDRDLTVDWTEVVLLGRSDEHDTVSLPLGPDKPVDRSYIPTTIFRRFARFSNDVEVMIDTAMTKGGGKDETGRSRRLRTLEEVLPRLPQWQAVMSESSGVIVRYIHDPKHPVSGHSASARANPATGSTTFCALVHKNERYDLKTQKAWSAAAPNFGIAFGSKVLTIEIEIPADLALPNQYRDGLTWPSDRETMTAEDFAPLVRELMPDWVREIVRAESPQQDDKLDDLREDLQKLLDEFKLPTQILSTHPHALEKSEGAVDGIPDVEPTSSEFSDDLQQSLDEVARREGHKAGERKVRLAPAGAQASELRRALERAPEIQILFTEEDVREKGIQGRAGAFYKDIQTLFVNGLYSAVDRMAHELQREFPNGNDPEQVRAVVVEAAQRWTAFRVGKATCYALAKRILDDWTSDDLDKATSPESLSLAADDYRQSLTAAKRWVAERLKVLDLPEVA